MPQPRATGRPATWCSDRCKRAAYEERRAAANGAIAVKIIEKVVERDLHGLSECSNRVKESPVACRRVLDHLAGIVCASARADLPLSAHPHAIAALRSLVPNLTSRCYVDRPASPPTICVAAKRNSASPDGDWTETTR